MNTRIHPEYWLRIAHEVAKASTCKANVGCVLVHKKMIVGIGYVGSIHSDGHCDVEGHINVPAAYRGENAETCIRTIHAEVNAVLKCMVRGSHDHGFIECYSTHQPCCECLKMLLQIGVRDVYYTTPYEDARREIFMQQSLVRNWGYKVRMTHVRLFSNTDIQEKVADAIRTTHVMARLLVDEETTNPDVVTPLELNEIVAAIMGAINHETRS